MAPVDAMARTAERVVVPVVGAMGTSGGRAVGRRAGVLVGAMPMSAVRVVVMVLTVGRAVGARVRATPVDGMGMSAGRAAGMRAVVRTVVVPVRVMVGATAKSVARAAVVLGGDATSVTVASPAGRAGVARVAGILVGATVGATGRGTGVIPAAGASRGGGWSDATMAARPSGRARRIRRFPTV